MIKEVLTVIVHELGDISNILFGVGLGGFLVIDRIADTLTFIDTHQAAIAFLVFMVLGVVKKVYDIKTARDTYITHKNKKE